MKQPVSVIRSIVTSGVALLALSTWAAPVEAQGIEFSGGVNFATLSGDAVQNAARRLGANFGVDLIIPAGPLGLNLGADFSRKGVEEMVSNELTLVDLTYIEVPVHVRIPLVGAGPVRLNLVLGPTIGINLGCDLTINQSVAEACADAVEGFEPNQLDWSGAAGLGVSFRVGGLAYMGADLKYTLGLTQLSDDIAESLKNRAFALQTHIGFDIF